jgi:hypothetical protein
MNFTVHRLYLASTLIDAAYHVTVGVIEKTARLPEKLTTKLI